VSNVIVERTTTMSCRAFSHYCGSHSYGCVVSCVHSYWLVGELKRNVPPTMFPTIISHSLCLHCSVEACRPQWSTTLLQRMCQYCKKKKEMKFPVPLVRTCTVCRMRVYWYTPVYLMNKASVVDLLYALKVHR